MILNNTKDIKYGSRQVQKVYKGSKVVWNASVLPIGYKRCLFLESHGTEWIDTGYTYSNSNDRINVILAPMETNVDKSFVGSYANGACELGQIQGWFRCNVNGVSSAVDTQVTIGNIYHYSLTDGKWVDTDRGYTAEQPTSIPQSHSALLFARWYSGNATKMSKVRIYSFEVLNDGVHLKKFVPCLDANNIPCMYDTVSQQSFYNQGTGTFGYELMDGTYVAPTN